MKFYESGAALAQDMGVPVLKMEESIEAHYQASVKTAEDPDGGPCTAFPSGKSWDETSDKTGLGKNFYHNVISRADFAARPCHVAIITPVIAAQHTTSPHHASLPMRAMLDLDVKSGVLGADYFLA